MKLDTLGLFTVLPCGHAHEKKEYCRPNTSTYLQIQDYLLTKKVTTELKKLCFTKTKSAEIIDTDEVCIICIMSTTMFIY